MDMISGGVIEIIKLYKGLKHVCICTEKGTHWAFFTSLGELPKLTFGELLNPGWLSFARWSLWNKLTRNLWYMQRIQWVFDGMVHEDVIKWKHLPCYWPFVQGNDRSPGNSPHKGQWRGALITSLIGVWINGWGNNREAGDLRRNRAHCDVIVKCPCDARRFYSVRHSGRRTVSWGGVTKSPFVDFSVRKLFDLAKVPVIFLE